MLLADALTTALFFVEPETSLKYFDVDYPILYPNQSVKMSIGFSAEAFE